MNDISLIVNEEYFDGADDYKNKNFHHSPR